eukprot:scaffold192_cov190-Pinguiococcus_pyrenoidosus.AAC.2
MTMKIEDVLRKVRRTEEERKAKLEKSLLQSVLTRRRWARIDLSCRFSSPPSMTVSSCWQRGAHRGTASATGRLGQRSCLAGKEPLGTLARFLARVAEILRSAGPSESISRWASLRLDPRCAEKGADPGKHGPNHPR